MYIMLKLLTCIFYTSVQICTIVFLLIDTIYNEKSCYPIQESSFLNYIILRLIQQILNQCQPDCYLREFFHSTRIQSLFFLI
jgi:hypothetical protein